MSFRNFTTSDSHSFGGEHLELTVGERLIYTDRFDDPDLPREMKITVTLKATSVGADMTIMQDGVPDAILPESCCLGWQESLQKSAKLVEPAIDVQRRADCPPTPVHRKEHSR